jgi:hypothetical protein
MDARETSVMRPILKFIFRCAPLLLLAACVSMPDGPSIMALPGNEKNFDQFRHDDYACRYYAHEYTDGSTAKGAAINSGLNSAAIGAALGAIAGVALGGGQGAAIGAGTGVLAGGLVGTDNARTSGLIIQQRYDQGYMQCMYAKGHHVPVAGTFRNDLYDSGRNIIPPSPPGYPSAPLYR